MIQYLSYKTKLTCTNICKITWQISRLKATISAYQKLHISLDKKIYAIKKLKFDYFGDY